MTTKGKESTGEEVVIEVPWDFHQKNREGRPDFFNDPIEEVEEYVSGLPMSDEYRKSLMALIREEREKTIQPQP